ncbi:TetR/AcrR family transcriptional regulator [Granulicella arctica]|uniref:TetR/AcrR family transcriptional regulator n=1 Tax=Granulicella arctica TaxID=940613 RepID=UPI0021E00FE7|nr:TetR/AcrR family transcriptional regulator [Granulicella arctica]
MARKEPTSRNSAAKTHLLDTAQRIVGAKGFSGVGLNQLLGAACIPKGSFYYYFASKDAFGKDLLEHYFEKDLSQIDKFLSEPGRTARERLIAYWRSFRKNQEHDDPDGKCLAVKLGAEVSDMSEGMRLALKAGTSAIISRLARILKEGMTDGSIVISGSPGATALTLYQLWMGASVMAKISHDRGAFIHANATTERILAGEAL